VDLRPELVEASRNFPVPAHLLHGPVVPVVRLLHRMNFNGPYRQYLCTANQTTI
jgi:hypothetical protein